MAPSVSSRWPTPGPAADSMAVETLGVRSDFSLGPYHVPPGPQPLRGQVSSSSVCGKLTWRNAMGILSLSVGATWPRAAVWGLKLSRQAPGALCDPGLLTPG